MHYFYIDPFIPQSLDYSKPGVITIQPENNTAKVQFFDSYVYDMFALLLCRVIMEADVLQDPTRIRRQMTTVLFSEVITLLLKE